MPASRCLIFGASGMVGAGVLIECLHDPRVERVLVVGRTTCGVTHPKLTEILHADLYDVSALRERLTGHTACFFCLGVTSVGMTEAAYHRVTYDLTMGVARLLAEVNPGMTFCYVSGEGTDSSERSRAMWARVKGKTENHLMQLALDAYAFRPGYIQPLKGVRSKTWWYQWVYNTVGMMFPLVQRVARKHVTTTENVGRAMIEVAEKGYEKRVLENDDINRGARRREDGKTGRREDEKTRRREDGKTR